MLLQGMILLLQTVQLLLLLQMLSKIRMPCATKASHAAKPAVEAATTKSAETAAMTHILYFTCILC